MMVERKRQIMDISSVKKGRGKAKTQMPGVEVDHSFLAEVCSAKHQSPE